MCRGAGAVARSCLGAGWEAASAQAGAEPEPGRRRLSGAWAEGCAQLPPGVMPDAVSRGARRPLLLTGDSARLSPSPVPVPGDLLCSHQMRLEELWNLLTAVADEGLGSFYLE